MSRTDRSIRQSRAGNAVQEPTSPRSLRNAAAMHDGGAPSAAAPIAESAVSFELMSSTRSELVATAGDCLVLIMLSPLTMSGVNGIERGLAELTTRYDRVGYLSFIDAEVMGPMKAEARVGMAQLIRRYTKSIRSAAVVVNGTGFRATAARSIVTAIHLASFGAHPLKTFANLDLALAWHDSKRLGSGLGGAELGRIVGELRGHASSTASSRRARRPR